MLSLLNRNITTKMASILFVTDFDLTLTQKDTSYLAFKSKQKYIDASNETKLQFIDEWNKRGKSYYENYLRKIDDCLLTFPPVHQLNIEVFKKFMEEIDNYNLNSRYNLAEAEMFHDVVTHDLHNLIQEIDFYPHAKETLEKFQEDQKIASKILSVNWFPNLLHLSLSGLVTPDNIVSAHLPKFHNKTTSNNTDWPGVEFGPCASCCDKQSWIKKWNDESNHVIIYAGDSITDLLALVEATYGIIFGESKNTRKVAKHFGIIVKPLASFNVDTDICKSVLYSTSSWLEIESFVDQLKNRVL